MLKQLCIAPIVRELSSDEIEATEWGKFTDPWEPYRVSQVFGHGPITRLSG